MKTWKILVTGRVQKVGYRRLVDEIAYRLGVNGCVKNLEDKRTVEVIAQHENEEMLKRFVEFIKINEYPVKVERVESCEIEAQNYSDFQVIEGSLELENRESLEAGVIYIRKLADEMKKTREDLGGKIDRGFSGTNERFDTLDKKYGTVSKSLEEISKDLKEINGNLRPFKPKE